MGHCANTSWFELACHTLKVWGMCSVIRVIRCINSMRRRKKTHLSLPLKASPLSFPPLSNFLQSHTKSTVHTQTHLDSYSNLSIYTRLGARVALVSLQELAFWLGSARKARVLLFAWFEIETSLSPISTCLWVECCINFMISLVSFVFIENPLILEFWSSFLFDLCNYLWNHITDRVWERVRGDGEGSREIFSHRRTKQQ